MKTVDRISHNYIVVEGSIGVGKAKLAGLIAERYNGRAIFENKEENPFLSKFYEDSSKYAFQTQMYFLLNRFTQYKREFKLDLFSDFIITNFMMEKDFIFASVNLSEEEFYLYRQVYELIKKELMKPDLIVYLYCTTEELIKKIKKRNIKYEKSISYDYLDKINKAYNEYFMHYDETPVLFVNIEHIDFEQNPDDLYSIINEIENTRFGKRYYNTKLNI